MAWFTPDAIAFFAELEQNNSREWFEPNKKRYEASVKGPMLEFAAEMIERMRALDPGISMLPRNAVFRIHRDTRFSPNKTPYKTNAGLVVSRGERHSPGTPGLYFHFDAGRMAVASGLYFLEPAQIKLVRAHIAANLDEFEGLLGDARWREKFGEMAGEKNKVLPPELKAAAQRQPLLYNKQFFYWSEHPAQEIKREDLPDFVMSHIEAAWPMNEFLTRAL
ncbi:MAG TPA: DUF2461 domain-containing protein [Fimbriimonadaceae bacterium]|nr:DUF2461 domain-containing protein [Fimbriimonadaceae bacterium]